MAKKVIRRKRSHKSRSRKRVSGVNPAVVSGTRKKTTRRRRKKSGVGALTGNDFFDAFLGAVTGVGIKILERKMIPQDMINPKYKDLIEDAIGVGAIWFGYKKKNNFIIGAGVGFTALSMEDTLKDFGVINGFSNFMQGLGLIDDEDSMIIEISGVNDEPNQVSVMSGQNPGQDMMNGDMPSVVSGQ